KTTSNAMASTGDGMAIAYRAGALLEDMEFIQFHPTGIYKLGILISEAARGEGGILLNGKGERFMERYAPTIKDLAPRDMVSRCILKEVRAGRGIDGKDYVHLDLTHLGAEVIGEKLVEIIEFAKTYGGVDARKEPIPVQPTCHYMMGGIAADADGRVMMDDKGTPFPGLYAAGECACVSVHGANRLGCNSLLDTLVFGRRSGIEIRRFINANGLCTIPDDLEDLEAAKIRYLMEKDGTEKLGPILQELQAVMMNNVSVFRHRETIEEALQTVRSLKQRFHDIGVRDKGTCFNRELLDVLELRHMLDLAEVMAMGALSREESRGAHSREDFPERDDKRFLVHTLVRHEEQADPQLFTKPVTITRFEPKERKY
ncbi:MAG: FAD-binding protein, partial [Desulfobacterales bacterium]